MATCDMMDVDVDDQIESLASAIVKLAASFKQFGHQVADLRIAQAAIADSIRVAAEDVSPM